MKCKIHPKYGALRPPRANCPDCQAMWEASPHRKQNVKRCLCLQCNKKVNRPDKQLYNYCFATKVSCEYKSCLDCLAAGDNQITECEVKNQPIE